MTNFRRIRDRLRMTQAELAEALGMTQGNVSFYEKGQTVPPPVARNLIAIAAARGHAITYDDVYAAPVPADAKRRKAGKTVGAAQ